MRDIVLAGQGAYYIVTGVWPLVSIGTFQRVTGPKVDTWLVKTVGVLLLVIGSVLVLAGARGRRQPEFDILAAGSALAVSAVEGFYALKGRISPVYLLDVVAEVFLVAALLIGRRRRPC